MKNLFLMLTLVFSVNSFAGVVATCKDAKIPAGEGRNGWTWQKMNLDMTVFKNRNFSAVIKYEHEVETVTKGIEVSNLNRLSFQQVEFLKMAKVPYKNVAFGTHYNFHPEANREDSSGFSLTVLNAKDGSVVAKVFSAGWAMGLCK